MCYFEIEKVEEKDAEEIKKKIFYRVFKVENKKIKSLFIEKIFSIGEWEQATHCRKFYPPEDIYDMPIRKFAGFAVFKRWAQAYKYVSFVKALRQSPKEKYIILKVRIKKNIRKALAYMNNTDNKCYIGDKLMILKHNNLTRIYSLKREK